MAIINVTEADFRLLANAAMDARDSGAMEAARGLDKLARKANLALTNNSTGMQLAKKLGVQSPHQSTWRDMPSTID